MKNQLKIANNKYNQKLLATTNQLDEVLSPIPDNPNESPIRAGSQDSGSGTAGRANSDLVPDAVDNARSDSNSIDENELVFNGIVSNDYGAESSLNAYSNSMTL